MKEKIMEVLNVVRDNPINVRDLYRKCGYYNYPYDDFLNLIDELVEEKLITCANSKLDLYKLNPYREGVFHVKRNGDCVVDIGDYKISIPKEFSYGSMEGDKVLVKVTNYDTCSGTIKEIIDRSGIVAELVTIEKVRYAKVGKDLYKISVPDSLVDGMLVGIKIDKSKAGKYYHASLDKVIGHKNAPGIEEQKILYEHEMPTSFSDAALKELDDVPTSVSDKDIVGRRDLRNEMIFTIDGDDTKDIDDAISCKKLENGNYELGVHIADVSFYVRPNTNIDLDARERTTSVYMPGVVSPMYPPELSNGICSLNPNVDRLTTSCVMEIDPNGNLVNFDIFKGVIRSRKQMTYKNVNKILNEGIIPEGYEEFSDNLLLMGELSKIFEDVRIRRGMINFDTSEIKINVEDGKTKSIERRVQDTAENLIENFMLAANECVATYIYGMGLAFIYRVHDLPSEERLKRVVGIIKSYGCDISLKMNSNNPRFIQKLMSEIKDSDNYEVFSNMILRCMAKAAYEIVNLGHFGIGVDANKGEAYTHFTSPIRRYPDTMVHRILGYILDGDYDKVSSEEFKTALALIAKHCSENELKADQCEREANKMRMAQYMSDYINEQYLAKIVGFTSSGMFVQLDNLVEGRVGYNTMDDYYTYDEDLEIIVGEKSKKIYRLGDVVLVKLTRSDMETREIDFEVVKQRVRKSVTDGNSK